MKQERREASALGQLAPETEAAPHMPATNLLASQIKVRIMRPLLQIMRDTLNGLQGMRANDRFAAGISSKWQMHACQGLGRR